MLSDDQILEIRSRFPILQHKTYLYSCSQGALVGCRGSRDARVRRKLAHVVGAVGHVDGNIRSFARRLRTIHQRAAG